MSLRPFVETDSRGMKAGLVVIVGLLVVNAGLSYHNLTRLDEDARLVTHTYDVLSDVYSLHGQFHETTSRQRAILLTNDSSLTDAYQDSLTLLRTKIDQLQKLTADSSEQQQTIARLRRATENFVAEQNRAIIARREQGIAVAAELVQTEHLLPAATAVRSLLEELKHHEQQRLQERSEQARRSYLTAVISSASVAILGLAAVGMFVLLLGRHLESRRRAALLIDEQRQLTQATLSSISDGVIVTDAGGRITFLNPVGQMLTGWSLEQARGEPLEQVFRIVDEQTRETAGSPAGRALREGRIVSSASHTVLLARDGSERAIDDSASPIRREDGSLAGAVLVFRDVTERRRNEAALRERAELSMFEAEIGIVLTESDSIDSMLQGCAEVLQGRLQGAVSCLWLHRAEENILELRASAGRSMHDDAHLERIEVGPDGIGLIAQARQPLLSNSVAGDPRFHGQQWMARAGLVAIAGYPLVVGKKLIGVMALFARRELPETTQQAMGFVANAVSLAIERKNIEIEHARGEDRFRSLVTATSQIVWTTDPDGAVAADSPTWRAFTGQTLEEFRGAGWLDAVHPDDRASTAAAWNQAVETVSTYETEYRLRTVAGDYRRTLARGVPVLEADGAIREWVGTNTDVTGRREAEDNLRESEARFRNMADSAPVMIWVTEPDGACSFRSKSWYEYTGQSPASGLGFGWLEAVHPEDRSLVQEALVAANARQAAFRVEYRLRRAEGDYRWTLDAAAPRVGSDGRSHGFIGSVIDITDRKQSEEHLRETTRLAETLNRVGQQVSQHLDLESVVQIVTDESVRLIGAEYGAFFYNQISESGESYTLVSVSGAPREAFAGYPLPSNTALFSPTFNGDEPVRIDDVLKYPRFDNSGPYYGLPVGQLPVRSYLAMPVLSRAGSILGGLFLGHSRVGVFTELHERLLSGVAAQASIAMENSRLYGEVLDADRRKDEFLAMLGHELRNPLAGIVTGAEALGMLSLDEEAASVQAVIQRQAAHMSHIMDDLLDVSRIARGKLTLRMEFVELRLLVRETLEEYRTSDKLPDCELCSSLPEEDVWVQGDRTRLAQVLSNIIHNACKFSDGPNVVTVEVSSDPAAGLARLAISDRGIGMSPETVARMFEPFLQADTSIDRNLGGLGLGLALVRGLVQLHGGDVTAESQGLGKGTTIRITLPLDKPPMIISPTSAPPPTASIRILLIDDRRDAIIPLQKLLQRDGHHVATALDGPSGIATASEFLPEIVLCDIGLDREMNGYEVAQAMRAMPQFERTYLVAVSGYGLDDDRRRAREAGFDYHLTKPVGLDQLRDMLHRMPRFV